MIVYCITNKVNGKQYVGQTIESIKRRWNSHCKKGCFLYNAIKKYGKDNFKIDILEKCSSAQELHKREIYWIKKLNTCVCDNGNGYNLSTGGECGLKGYIHTKEDNRKNSENHCIPIICYYNAIIYPSIKEAAEKLGLNASNIIEVLKGKRKHTGGYHFEYLKEDTDIEVIKNGPYFGKFVKHGNKRASILCTTNGIIYPSGHEAARKLGLYQPNIWKVLNGIYKHTGGYAFEYVKKENNV